MHAISRATPTKPGGEVSHFAMDIIKDRPDLRSLWFLHHHTAPSDTNFQAFLLQKPESRTPATTVQQRKATPKRYCAATAVVISCCLKEGDIKPAMNIKEISEEEVAGPQIRQKDSTQRAMDIEVLRQYDGQSSNALVDQRDIVQTAALRSGSSSVKASDTSQLETQRSEASFMKKNEHLKPITGSTLQESLQKQLSLKAASSVDNNDDDDDDGFHIKRQLLLVSGEKRDSINRPQSKLRATQDDNKEDFSGRIITKQTELRRPEAGSETEASHTNTVENGNQKRLAHILQTGSTNQTDSNNVDHKETLTELGEEALITLFLPDTETETQTERKLVLKTENSWKIVNTPVKEPVDPPSMNKVIKENFIIQADDSKYECLRETLFSLYIYAIDRKERIDLKPAESKVKVTTAPEQVKETTEETQHAETNNNTPHENMSINQTKQGENVPSEETVITPPPSFHIRETVTAKTTEHTAQTATGNMEIKQTMPGSEVLSHGSTQRADGRPTTTMSPEPETDTEPGFTTRTTRNAESTTGGSHSGLRMREDITNPHEAAENKEREEEPGVTSFSFSQPLETAQTSTNRLPPSADDRAPPCRGLIHRTEAGWKHCMERFAGAGSKLISSRETAGAFKETGELEKGHDDNLPEDDDGYERFYYFDGVLKRVQNNYYPHYKSERRGKGKKGDTSENLLSYIHRLTLRNKFSHSTDHNVQRGSG
ncbi:uncharacterized protein LOC130186517 [Seriola aureovittata]|uniref:uncharacterized protein LOC130186517 n=1 Tax=Seriola aureovittata TaxID=2871759 RepID=UPI0024BEBB64|nr:uncharacterized protein LOC130186517 [Seriola aureovittata]